MTIDTTAPGVPATPALAVGNDSGTSSSDNLTNVTEPTLTGTAEVGATVKLYDGATEIGSGTADGTGNWSITLGSDLSSGSHNITATATDAAGNTSSASTALVVTIDATAPAAPSALALAAASDSGSSSSDKLTSVTKPTISGNAEAGATVKLYDGATEIGSGTADGTGKWSITLGADLSSGAHDLTAKATDAAGNTSGASAPLAMTIDTTAPDAPSTPALAAGSDSGASSSDNVTNVTKPTLSGTAEAGAIVKLYDGATEIGNGTADGTGNWSITLGSDLATGSHSITAKATDAAGNVSGASAALTVTIDTTAPAAPAALALAAGSDSGSSSSDKVTSVVQPTITGTAEAGATVKLYDGATEIGSGTADGSGNWSITANTLADGAHNITAKATDAAGNTGSASTALVVTIDATAPAAPSALALAAASDSGSSSSDKLTSVTKPTISGNAEAGATVKLYDGATEIGSGTADGTGKWSITLGTDLSSGAHNLTAKATDAAGNTSAASAALTVTIDATAPDAPSTPALAAGSDSGASSSDNVSNVTKPTLSGTAEAGAIVKLYDGATEIGNGTADGTGNWSITLGSDLATGAHSITATATDAAGNVGAASSALTVTIDTAAPAAPAALALASGSDSGSSSSDRVTSAVQPTITGTAEAGATVKLYDGATEIGSGTADGTGKWSISTTGTLADGSHNITAKATDAAGNVSVASSALAVTIDATAPAAPSTLALAAASDSGRSNSDGVTSVRQPTFEGAAEAGTTIKLYDDATEIGSGTADGTGKWSITPTANLSYGEHSITAKATDAAGNISGASSALAVRIDTIAPDTPFGPLLSPISDSGTSSSDKLTNVTRPTLGGLAEVGSVVKLYDGATEIGSVTPDDYYMWSITLGSDLAPGVHTITAQATDAAGNVSAASSALVITIDTAPPAAPAALALAPGSDSGSSSSDRVTNVSRPTITGTAEAGAIVRLYDGAWEIGSGTADGTGNWSIATTGLTSDVNNITATATDAAGNVSVASSTLVVTHDNSAPAAPSALALAAASDSGSSSSDRVTNVTQPTISGNAEAGTTVKLYDGATEIGGGTADGAGKWSITTTDNLSSGAHSITAKATDLAGNVSLAMGALAITIDTTAPVAPSTPALAAGSDSGSSSSDNLTKVTKPTLTGTAEAGATIKLYDGATEIGSGTADGTGKWSITLGSDLATGAHTVTAKATDAAGNVSGASDALGLTIDTTPPQVSISSDKAALRAGQQTLVTFQFSEEPGAAFALGSIQVSGGTLEGLSGTGNVRTATFTPDANANGTAQITVASNAYDDRAGNAGDNAAALNIPFDTLVPTLVITRDTNTPLKIGETATISFSFSEDPGTSFQWDGALGDLHVSGGTLSALSGTGLVRTATFTPDTNVNDGTAVISVSGSYTDAAENIGTNPPDLVFSFDTQAPAAPSSPVLAAGDDSGTSQTDNLTSVATPTLAGTAEAGATVKLYDGATLVGTGTADAAGKWSITTNALAEGSHAITAVATDTLLNTGTASAALAVTVDRTAPTLTISSDKAALTAGQGATITFTFSEDPGSTFSWDGTSGDIVVSGGTLGALSGTGNIRTAVFTPDADVNAGTASITVAAGKYTDAAGNDGGAGVTPSIHFDTLVPTVSISSDKAALRTGETATITFTFSEDPGASFTWDGTSGDVTVGGGTLSAISGSGLTRTATFTPTANTNGGVASIAIAEGKYSDAAGNAGHAGTSPSVVFDTLAPAVPSAPVLDAGSDSGVSNSDRLTNAASPRFTGTAEDGATVKLVDTVTETVLGTGIAAGGTWAINANGLTDGVANIVAIATDVAGNTGPASAASNLTIDRTAPVALSLALASGTGASLVSSGTVKVNGIEDGASWQYSLDGGAHWLEGSGSEFAVTVEGPASVLAHQTDRAGNMSAVSNALSFTLDMSGPTSSVSLSDLALTSGETATVTIRFNERAVGFDLGDIHASNATLSNLATSDGGLTWTALMTPQAGVSSTTNVISVDNTGVTDAVGNRGVGASTSANYTVQTGKVAAAIEMSDTSLLAGETALVTIRFGEAVTGFTLADLSAESGKLSNLASADNGRTWTALFTPATNIDDATNLIRVDNSGVIGAQGQRGEGTSSSANYTVNTIRPTASVTMDTKVLGPGASTPLTIKFSQPVLGFDSADLAVSHATVSALASGDGGMTWTATLTADAGGKSAAPGWVSIDMGGVKNSAGNAGTGSISAHYVVAPAGSAIGTVDGVQVVTQSTTDPKTGREQQLLMIPEVPAVRQDDPNTANQKLADIPLVSNPNAGSPPVLTAGLPAGAGLQVEGPAAPLSTSDALTDLIQRIQDKTASGSASQTDMTGQGQGFLNSLGAGGLVESRTIVPTVSSGTAPSQPIVISGAGAGSGPNAPVVGLVIDGSGLPAGSTLQLDNVDFAAVIGDVRLIGGQGKNYVVGDGASQTIYLGPDDDVLSGGGGDDFIGSAGGDDHLDGGDGNDLVAGGIGNDTVIGGAGDDMLNGGRSTVGDWTFHMTAAGAISAAHDKAVFSAAGSETVQGAELDATVSELGFLKAAPEQLAGIAMLYAGLDRAPDVAGLTFWARAGVSLADVANGVLASAEFGGTALAHADNSTFVRGMYLQVLGREPEGAAMEYWSARLSGSDGRAPASRADVLVAVALSDEHKGKMLAADGYTIAQSSLAQETAWFSGSGDDRLEGGSGHNLLVGGDGVDTAVYGGNQAQYHVLIGTDGLLRVADTTSDSLDKLSGIEVAEFKDGKVDLTVLGKDAGQLDRVGLMFQTVFHHAAGLDALKSFLALNTDAPGMARALVATSEFQSRFGGTSDAAFVQALYANSGLDASKAGGMQSWQDYLGHHSRAELIASWIAQDDVVHAQFGNAGLWLF
ncbi:Ig-like domain-containing protein [Massilia agilis]